MFKHSNDSLPRFEKCAIEDKNKSEFRLDIDRSGGAMLCLHWNLGARTEAFGTLDPHIRHAEPQRRVTVPL
jgi:hypothetical protein